VQLACLKPVRSNAVRCVDSADGALHRIAAWVTGGISAACAMRIRLLTGSIYLYEPCAVTVCCKGSPYVPLAMQSLP